MIAWHSVTLHPMARLSISLADEILEQVKKTKPSHRPMSQHIADLLVDALTAKKQKDGFAAIAESGEQNKISK